MSRQSVRNTPQSSEIEWYLEMLSLFIAFQCYHSIQCRLWWWWNELACATVLGGSCWDHRDHDGTKERCYTSVKQTSHGYCTRLFDGSQKIYQKRCVPWKGQFLSYVQTSVIEGDTIRDTGVSISTDGWWNASVTLLIEVSYFFLERRSILFE